MKKNLIFVCVGCLVILLGFSLGACASAEERPTEAEFIVETVVVEMEAAEPEEAAEEPMGQEPPEAPEGESDQANEETKAMALQAPPAQTRRMVIKDAEMELLVDNTDVAVAQVTQLAGDYGGYIISSQTFFQRDNKFATIRIGVPSGNFETVLNNLRNVAIKVIHEIASGMSGLSSSIQSLNKAAHDSSSDINLAKDGVGDLASLADILQQNIKRFKL